MASRTIPAFPLSLSGLLGQPRAPLFDLTIDVVTPMFGGGAEPGVIDPEQPVNAKSIRGHLRFWWRACNAHKYPTAQRLFEEEEKIWGSSTDKAFDHSGPSAIDIEVETDPRRPGSPFNPTTLGEVSYALFPFLPQGGQATTFGLEGVRFRLRLLAAHRPPLPGQPDLKTAAASALWGWISFGGVGARTRRGCGSLWCADARFHPPDVQNVVRWVQDNAAVYAGGARTASDLRVPEVNEARFSMKRPASEPIAVWTQAIGVMKQLRAQKDANRRSTWPDGKSVVELSKLNPTTTGSLVPYFPRAEFGLPIGFHFPNLGKSADRVLQPANSSRMASPFILKPLMIAANQGVGMMLLLHAPTLAGLGADMPLDLRGDGQTVTVKNSDWVDDPAKAGQVAALTTNSATNARDALFEFARSQGWTKAVEL